MSSKMTEEAKCSGCESTEALIEVSFKRITPEWSDMIICEKCVTDGVSIYSLHYWRVIFIQEALKLEYSPIDYKKLK